MKYEPRDWSRFGAPQLIPLRRSVALRAAMAALTLIASFAVYTGVASRCGVAPGASFAVAAFGALTLGMLAYERRQPAVLKIGPDSITASSREGVVLFAGRVVGCTQWSGLLLFLAVAGQDRKAWVRPLLIPADSMSARSFRDMAVRGRHVAR